VTSVEGEGIVAFTSLEVMATVSDTVLTGFQFASTAFTVTVNGAPAARAVGVPVLRWQSRAQPSRPALIIAAWRRLGIDGDGRTRVAPLVPSVMSLAVTVALPAVEKVTLKFFVPATNAAFAGKDALASDE